MKLYKTLHSFRQTLGVLKHQNPPLPPINPLHAPYIYLSNAQETTSTLNSPIPISLFQRNLSTSAQLVSENVLEEPKSTPSDELQKPLDVTRNGVIEIHGKIEENSVSDTLIDSKLKEIEELKKKLNNLEKEVKGMKGNDDHNVDTKKKNKRKKKKKKSVESLKLEEPQELVAQTKPVTSLHAVFTSNLSNANTGPVVAKQEKVKPQPMKKDKPVLKELSPEMAALAHRLHQDGYFEKVKSRMKKEFDLNAFYNEYAHCLLRTAAEKFGQDHQELVKWLSGSDMKKVALSGCPSLEKNTVLATKSLRTFFNIQEDIVCRGCTMKSSCKFANEIIGREKEKFNLAGAMRVLVTYSLGSTPEMAMSQEVKASVDKLLQGVINLGQ